MLANRRTILSQGVLLGAGVGLTLVGCASEAAPAAGNYPFKLTDAQWRSKLGTDAYYVLRKAGTERPGSSPLDHEKRAGLFACKGCGQQLFSSRTKFDSGTGWPSFWAPLNGAVGTTTDRTLGMTRVEVHCARCGGHLGHVFDDGPKPTGKRYCMNGIAMTFTPGQT